MSNDKFLNRCYAISIIGSNNSNFNSDFTGNPRRLPDEDGTIFATDKVLKYSIRRYWVDNGKDVFVWRSHKPDGKVRTREERKTHMEERLFKSDDKISLVDLFSKCLDVKLFGITYTGDKNALSLTGPLQISYGINRLEQNTNYVSDILSPYADKVGASQGSVGKDVKNLNSYYVYDLSLNPKNIESHYNDDDNLKNKMSLTSSDILSLKEALKYSVTALDTTSKKDIENLLLLYIEMEENSMRFLPSMKSMVNINQDEKGQISIDLGKVFEVLQNNKADISKIELFYNKYKIISNYDDYKSKFNDGSEKMNIESL